MHKVLVFFWNRVNESSSWRGLVLILTALGVSLSPEQGEAIIALGLAIAGTIGAFFPNRLASTRTRKTDYPPPVAEPIDPFGSVQHQHRIGPDAPAGSAVPPVDYARQGSESGRYPERADDERWQRPYRPTPDERIAGYQPNDDKDDEPPADGPGPLVPGAGGDR